MPGSSLQKQRPHMTPTTTLRDRLASGDLTATDLAERCIARIEAREPEIRAWAWFDPARIRAEARRLDEAHSTSGPIGPPHGLPVGPKDVIDTAGIPTENGCPVDAGRIPDEDATLVTALKDAGALIMGKTATTELAFLHPGKTRNPRNPDHTPGGSSSGSAAAVADGMIPLAVGTQTGGSVIRPASFCGIPGFKPSFGAIPRDGVLMQSHSLDTLGVFAGDVDGLAILADVLMTTGLATGPRDTAPTFAFAKPPEWERADTAVHQGLATLFKTLGDRAFEAELPAIFADAAHHRATINAAEMAHHYDRYLVQGADRLGPPTRAEIERGQTLPATDYISALELREAMTPALETIFTQADAIICPAALGPAPETLASTGDSIFNGLWTMAGTPAVTLPMLTAANGLPVGVQIVGRNGDDAALMATARWLWERCNTV